MISDVANRPVLTLRRRSVHELSATSPFNFRLTFWKPSHFSTDLETHTHHTTWRTLREGEAVIGFRIDQVTPERCRLAVYSDRSLTASETERVVRRVEWSYGFKDDLLAFDAVCRTAPVHIDLTPVRGMRISCPESVFEIAIISLLLQNTTIARTRQMMRSLLTSYGQIVRFDGVTLRAFFSPPDILSVDELRFRNHDRLGYRAKYLPEFARYFSTMGLSTDSSMHTLAEDLESIRGIGPYSAAVISSAALRNAGATPLDVWNVQILHESIFGVPGRDSQAVQEALAAHFPGAEGLAALYMVETKCLATPAEPLMPSEAAARRLTRQRLKDAPSNP